MNKKLIVIGIVLVFLVIGLSGCLSSDKDKFVGTWTDTNNQIVTFHPDGAFAMAAGVGQWHLSDGRLIMTAEGRTIHLTYRFLNGNTVQLIDVETNHVEIMRRN